MTISKENLQVALEACKVLIRRGEKSLEMIREQEEYERRIPWARITFADPTEQAKADREALEHERRIRDNIAKRKLAVRELKAALK